VRESDSRAAAEWRIRRKRYLPNTLGSEDKANGDGPFRLRASRRVLITKACIMAIPPRLAPELVDEPSRVMVQAKIEKALKEALTLLAREGGDAEAKSPQIP
jgi:hypothetical protein